MFYEAEWLSEQQVQPKSEQKSKCKSNQTII